MNQQPTTYGSYLRIGELLELQRATEPHDELLFVVIHQSHELWFKLLLHELDAALLELGAGDLSGPRARVLRMTKIMGSLVSQWDVLDTMTPVGYLEFRDSLEGGSGFQSAQFRELEVSLGHVVPDLSRATWLTPVERTRIEGRTRRPSLCQLFLSVVAAEGRELAEVVTGRADRDLAQLAEALVDLDEVFAHWRSRHVLAVERQIGTKPGTGGSSGVGYLRATTAIRFFPELWEVRSTL